MTLLTVGVGQEYTTIAAAVAASAPGDTIAVQGGPDHVYTNDFFTIQHSLTLQAVGGEVVMVATAQPPNGKAMITEGLANTPISVSIIGFDISGVTVPDNNGAAIRYEGGDLTLVDCYIHNNQEGLLGAPDPDGTITIQHSEFAFNGDGSGSTHDIYVGHIATFTLTDSYIHDTSEGHEVKSRAENNIITNNRIFDNNSTASYSIDLPNGGNATITGNILEQGPNTHNPAIIAYGEEGASNAGRTVTIANNTIVNDDPNGVGVLNPTGIPLGFTGNAVFNLANLGGALAETDTTILTARPILDTSHLTFLTAEPVCYLRGTHLATPAGESKIEDLVVGDLVLTVTDGDHIARAVRWVGHRRIDLTRHPRPETVAPIRIERDAFADNVPHRDLLVSPDHAIFVDGKLICARQLVNGTTIRREKGWFSVDYYHVELNEHAILLAEGLPAESYLDTGNRGFFANAGAPLVLHPDLTDETDRPTRETGSCAPFVWDEASVRPVWQRLADRAGSSRKGTTTDADPRLVADGRTVKPVFNDDDRVMFMLPRGAREIRLVSRAQSPTEARPWLNDQRRLGMRVKRIVLRDGDETREVPMDHPDITRGWWNIEHDGPMMSRWTMAKRCCRCRQRAARPCWRSTWPAG